MGYHTPAGGTGHGGAPVGIRLTHADRDAAAEQLQEAYALGRLDEEELDHRLDLAMRAKVPADIEPLMRDLQVRPTAAPARQGEAPAEVRPDERLWAAGSHLTGYLTLCLGPLVALLVKGGDSPFVRRHAMEALNYQLTFLVFSILLVPIAIVTLGLGALAYVLFVLGWVFLPAIAAVAAAIGASWRYPFTWRAVKDR
jgi:uncharacterized Tic20 family protein